MYFKEIFTYLSLPSDTIKTIRSDSEKLMEEKFKRNHSEFTDAKKKPEQTDEQLKSVETKWVTN